MTSDGEQFTPDDHETQEIVEKKRTRFALPSFSLPKLGMTGLGKLPFNRSVLTALAVGVALIIWLVSGLLSQNNAPVAKAKPIVEMTAEQQSFSVVTRMVEAEDVQREIFLQGRTEADKRVTLAAETNGVIAKLPTDKGAFVQKGQVICQIDIGARQAQVDEARALRDARRIEYRAARNLVKKGHASKSQLAASRAAYDAAIANVKARLIELDRTSIRAPFDGILDDQPVKVGDFISVGRPCGTIIDKDPILIVANVAENRINSLNVGTTGRASLVTGQQVTGIVRYIAEIPEPTTRTFRIELEVDNKDLELRDGITAEAAFAAGEVRATRIPQSAMVLNDAGDLGVRVIEGGNMVRFRPVEIVSDDIAAALVIGLKEREQLIISGASFTRDGQIVTAVDEGDAIAGVQ